MKNKMTLIFVVMICMHIHSFDMTDSNIEEIDNIGNVTVYTKEQGEDLKNNDIDMDYSIDDAKYPELYKFFMKHRCPQEVENIQQEAENVTNIKRVESRSRQSKIFKYNNLPYYNKGVDIARIDNARRMKKVIEEEEIETIEIAKKCLYCSSEGLLSVIAFEPDFNKNRKERPKISVKMAEDMILLTEKTGYKDWNCGNLLLNKNDKWVIIDTEDASFRDSMDPFKIVLSSNEPRFLLDKNTEDFVYKKRRDWENYFYYKSLRYRYQISQDKKYDDPDINFKQVKKELMEFIEEVDNHKKIK